MFQFSCLSSSKVSPKFVRTPLPSIHHEQSSGAVVNEKTARHLGEKLQTFWDPDRHNKISARGGRSHLHHLAPYLGVKTITEFHWFLSRPFSCFFRCCYIHFIYGHCRCTWGSFIPVSDTKSEGFRFLYKRFYTTEVVISSVSRRVQC